MDPIPGWGTVAWIPAAASSIAGDVDGLFYLILGITGFFLLLVFGALLYAVIRFRASRAGTPHYSHGSPRLELLMAIIPTAILLGIAFYSDNLWDRIKGPQVEDAFVVRIEPRQFQWDVRYSGPDGRFDTEDDVTALNQLRLPVDRWCRIEMDAQDVIHSFFVPEFRIKQDAVPGTRSTILVKPTRTGTFEIACAELCGLGHYRMRGKLTVMDGEEFEKWVGGWN